MFIVVCIKERNKTSLMIQMLYKTTGSVFLNYGNLRVFILKEPLDERFSYMK